MCKTYYPIFLLCMSKFAFGECVHLQYNGQWVPKDGIQKKIALSVIIAGSCWNSYYHKSKLQGTKKI